MADTVPPAAGNDERKPRTLILCFDGTANQFDGDNTNVVKFYSLLQKDENSDQQLCYYQPGIGTYLNPGVVSPVFQWAAKILDEAFAWYLDAHVRGGYQFLMQNYVAGDKICIFGFSRGAYTARALAGMLHKIGLLPRDNPEQIPFAYKLYKQTDSQSLELAAGFKQTFCRDVQIEFVGVWDTVSSVGVIMGRTLPFTTGNTTVKTFRHAFSLDEHRVKFLPNLYHRPTPEEKEAKSRKKQPTVDKVESSGTRASGGSERLASPKKKKLLGFLRRLPSKSKRDAAALLIPKVQTEKLDVEAGLASVESPVSTSQSAPGDTDDEIPGGTDVLEVWFAGCHADVGGGAVTDDVKISLSDITLRWMVREIVQAQCGITFDADAIVRANLPQAIFTEQNTAITADDAIASSPRKLKSIEDVEFSPQLDPASPASGGGPESGSQDGSDPLDVNVDALQPINDELKLDPLWWGLEIVPLSYQYQDADGNWKTKWWIHLGRGREIPDNPTFHMTVKQRMQDKNLKYTPRAKWTAGTETYVQ